MREETGKLTIRLPRQDLEFAKSYAKAHGISVTEFVDRYLRHMRGLETRTPAAELDPITGLVPPEIDVEEEYRRHVLDKHGR